MAVPNSGMKRRPTHPGEMLREDFIPDYQRGDIGHSDVQSTGTGPIPLSTLEPEG